MRKGLLIGAVVFSGLACPAQNNGTQDLREPRIEVVIPESGFISSHQYISAYFGFVLSLPKGHFSVVDKSHDMWALRHDLLFVRSIDAGLSISATPVIDSAEDEAQRTALTGTAIQAGAAVVEIGGRAFWKSELEEEVEAGIDPHRAGRKWWRLSCATALRGFVIHFFASSYDEKLVSELRRCIESIEFFDPNQAAEWAGKGSRPFLPQIGRLRVASAPHTDVDHLDPGSTRANVYTNSRLGFSYIFPTGWYAADAASSRRTERIRRWAGVGTIPLAATRGVISERCERVLSWATKFPEQDPTHAFNSRIVIFAADPMCFAPNVRFPASVQNRSAIELFGNALMLAFSSSSLLPYSMQATRGTALDGHLFFEVSGAAPIPPQQGSLSHRAFRSLILTTMNCYWVIWLFESDTESDVYNLVKSGIIFDSAQPPPDKATH